MKNTKSNYSPNILSACCDIHTTSSNTVPIRHHIDNLLQEDREEINKYIQSNLTINSNLPIISRNKPINTQYEHIDFLNVSSEEESIKSDNNSNKIVNFIKKSTINNYYK